MKWEDSNPSKAKYALLNVFNTKLEDLSDIEGVMALLEGQGFAEQNHYKAFHPLVRAKGHLNKLHVTKVTNYARFLYLNPIEGVLISYKQANKFPHDPNNIINLNQITDLSFMKETKWYFTKGCYYMNVKTDSKNMVFMDDNLDVINFWLNQIALAKKFYVWLKKLTALRYENSCQKLKSGCCKYKNNPNSMNEIQMVESIINTLLKLNLPEVDID